MIPTELLRLRAWLAIHEAAAYIARGLSTSLHGFDVIRLGLDGYLPLSLYLPVDTKVDEYLIAPQGTEALRGVTRIEGLWDLVLDSTARKQLEHDYQFAANHNFIPIGEIGGAAVQSGAFRFRLDPQPARSGFSTRPRSAFPEGSVLAVRTTALDAFVAATRPATTGNAAASPATTQETFVGANTLGERERTTLLTIIAALCRHGGVDIGRPSAAGTTIEAMTESLGARVSARTIEEHLKRVPDALEKRGKTGS